MIFYIEEHGKLIDAPEYNSHKEALNSFREKYLNKPEMVLRDWQLYKVTEETLAQCIANTSVMGMMYPETTKRLKDSNRRKL